MNPSLCSLLNSFEPTLVACGMQFLRSTGSRGHLKSGYITLLDRLTLLPTQERQMSSTTDQIDKSPVQAGDGVQGSKECACIQPTLEQGTFHTDHQRSRAREVDLNALSEFGMSQDFHIINWTGYDSAGGESRP